MGKSIAYRNSIFLRLFITFILVMLPLCAIGVNIYNWGIRTIRDEIAGSMQTQNSFYIDQLQNEIYRIKNMQFSMLYDEDVIALAAFASISGIYDRDMALLRLQQKIYIMKGSSRYIGEIRVFITPVKKIITTTSILDLEDAVLARLAGSSFNKDQILSFDGNRILLTARRTVNDYGNLPDQLIHIEIEINNAEIRNMLAKLKVYESSEAFIYDRYNKFPDEQQRGIQ